jgi:hypothetical protein
MTRAILLWSLRAILFTTGALKLMSPSEGALWVILGLLEVAAGILTFAPGELHEQALRGIFWGFLGAGGATLAMVLLNPAVGSAPCGCLGTAVVLRRDHALMLQGLIMILAALASRAPTRHRVSDAAMLS